MNLYTYTYIYIFNKIEFIIKSSKFKYIILYIDVFKLTNILKINNKTKYNDVL